MNLQPHLIGKQVELRPMLTADFPDLLNVASDPLIWEQHPHKDRYLPKVFEKYLSDAMLSKGAMTILDRASQKIIGASRFYFHKDNQTEIVIGYTFLSRAYWGGVYNSEVKKLMIEYAFQNVNTVCFHVGQHNFRSRKAVEKIGGIYDHQFPFVMPDGSTIINFCYKILKN